MVKISNNWQKVGDKKPAIIFNKIMQVIVLKQYYLATEASVVIFTVIRSPTFGT